VRKRMLRVNGEKGRTNFFGRFFMRGLTNLAEM
jgi:hypothetical protein